MATLAEYPPKIGPQSVGVEVQDCASLTDKTVFLKVRFGSLGNSRKVSGTEVLETDADKALLKVSKTLLDSEELEAIKKADGKMRQYLYNSCLPFDVGTSLLPVGLITDVQQKLTEYKAEREKLVATFVAAYPVLCKNAASRLQSLYRDSDYPTAEAIQAKFIFDWQYVSFGVPGHLKGISAGLFKAEQEKAANQMQAATEEITLLMRQTLLDMVSHLQERLAPGDEGKPKILRESAITKTQEFLSTFDLRNVTDDKELAAVVAKAKAIVSGTNAEALRNSDVWREKVRSSMEGISAELSGMIEEKSGRKYRDE